MPSTESIGFIGLGLLGSALTGRLMNAGYSVTGYDLEENARKRFLEAGGKTVESIPELLDGTRKVILCLPNSNISFSVSREILSCDSLPEMIIDTTTGDPSDVEQIAVNFASHNVTYLDATVGGSSEQAKSGEIILMIGGDKKVFEECEDLWKAWTDQYFYMGDSGSGSRMKLVMNLVLGLNRAVLAEGLCFADGLGISKESALGILKSSPAFSEVMMTKGEKMVQDDFEPQAKLSQHLKDVRLINQISTEKHRKTPLSELHELILTQLVEEGLGDLDNSAVIKYFR